MKFSEWVLASPLATIMGLLLIVLIGLMIRYPNTVEQVVHFALSTNADDVYTDTLFVYSFPEYFEGNNVTRAFEEKYKIKIHVSEFRSNEQLYDSLIAGNRYDIIVPSDYMVTQMSNEGLLMTIDRNLISNYSLIDIRFNEMDYDYGNRYSIPYFWGSIGLMYDNNYVPNPPLSWSAVFDTTEIIRMRYNVSLLDDPRITLGIALITLGYSPNTSVDSEIREATDKLIGLAKYMSSLQSESLEPLFKENSLNISMNWSGNAALVASRNSTIRFSLPSEGSIFFVDNMAIPINAKNPQMAHTFIDFFLDPQNAAELTNTIYYPNPITESRKYVDRIILKGPSYLNPFLSSNVAYIRDLGIADTLYIYHWRRFRDIYNKMNMERNEMQDGNNRIILF